MTLDFLTADDITILNRAYESYGGLLKYLEIELKGKVTDFIKANQLDKIDIVAVKTEIVAEIVAEKLEADKLKEVITTPIK